MTTHTFQPPRMPSIIIAALTVMGTAQPAVPFVMPWDDSTPGITDFSALNTPISPNARVTVDTTGHFVVNSNRIRFLGMNFAGQLPFTPTNKTEAVAARLAKFGINCVRFHHMDAPWAQGGGLLAYTSTTSTNINPVQLERLHYTVARLKEHGIYSDINLLVGRQYRSRDGLGSDVVTMDWKDTHVLGYFNDTALALQKDYARKVLTPTNRFTGLPLAKDPAVAFVEIINENGIVQKWLDGGLDRLPASYAAQLGARWNDWLALRYTNDTALLAAWRAIDQPLGPNLLKNGAFSNALSYWTTEQHSSARAVSSRTYDFIGGAPSAQIKVTQTSSEAWHIQFNQAGLSVTVGQPYTITFWAKSDPPASLDVSVMQAHADWQAVGFNQRYALSTNWQQFTRTFIADRTDTNVRVNFGGMGTVLGTFWIADVRFHSGGQVGLLPPGTSLATRTIPRILYSGDGYTGTAEARKDWLRFLRDLEFRYYEQMLECIRSECGYNGLVFGTIMANSPATVQSRLDVIDGHAYWQHPVFPGTAWDMSNWYVRNVSMVNTLGDDNTLAGLARQRIKGKPFTVTEYNHPQPNYYGAEGPLLLAAYAAFQDWDGVWMFDYGHGQDGSTTMGWVQGFFDTAQHPGKMANLLLAANLLRRGDIQPGQQEITTALTPETEIDILLKSHAWGIFSSSQLGVPGKLAFARRLSTSVGTNVAGLTNPPVGPTGSIITSDTAELTWDLSIPERGLVKINTPRTRALVGWCTNKIINLGELTFAPNTNMLGWCTIAATIVRGDSFTNECQALLVATGWWENTGQTWKNAEKSSLSKFGGPPVLTEVVPFTLSLPLSTNRVRVWALDERGQRKASVPVTGNATSAVIVVTTNSSTIWYEINVAPLTGYAQWQTQNFTAVELLNPAVSGESATPAGDGVPNLVKYYLGLPAKTPAPADRLPLPALILLGEQSFLAIQHLRDKTATDVKCNPETSNDLQTWESGPSAAILHSVEDLGPLERVTFRDTEPITAHQQRFMRLAIRR